MSKLGKITKANKETKNAVSEVRMQAFDGLINPRDYADWRFNFKDPRVYIFTQF